MKKSRIFMALILAFLFVFTASALELDVAEGETAVLAEDYGELVFSVDFEGLTSIARRVGVCDPTVSVKKGKTSLTGEYVIKIESAVSIAASTISRVFLFICVVLLKIDKIIYYFFCIGRKA